MELFYCQSLLRRAPTGASSWTTANQPCQGTCSDFSAQQSKPVAADWCYHVERPTWAAEHIKHDHASATEGASCRCGGRRERCRCGGSGTEPAQAARAGAALRNWLKFTLGLLIGMQEAEKVWSKFTCQYANDERKFTLRPNKFTSEVTKQPKKFTLMQKKFTFKQKKFTFWWKSLHHLSKIAKKVHIM